MEIKVQKVQQYIELVYSEKSPFIQSHIGLEERKLAACKKLSLDTQDEDVKKLIDLTDEKQRDRIIEYLCKNESNEFMNLMSDQHLFLEIQVLKMTPLTPTEDDEKMMKAINLKTTMSQKSDELLVRMNASYMKIFKGESEVKAAKKKVQWITLEQRIKKRDEQKANVSQNQ